MSNMSENFDPTLLDTILREHGSNGPYYHNEYSGPIEPVDELDSIIREHGVLNMLGADDFLRMYGTMHPDLMKEVKNLFHVSGISSDYASEIIKKLPDRAIEIILERRYRQVAQKLDDKNCLADKYILEVLGSRLYVDLNIITEILSQNRNLYEKNLNLATLVGVEDYQNIIGLISRYKEKLEGVPIEIPLIDSFNDKPFINPATNESYKAIDLLARLEQYAKTKGAEFGIDVGGRSM